MRAAHVDAAVPYDPRMLLAPTISRMPVREPVRIPPPVTETAGYLFERGMAIAAVAAHSPVSSSPERLLHGATVARQGAALLEAHPTNKAGEDRALAASKAREGAHLLASAASMLASSLPADERHMRVAALACDGYATLVQAYGALRL